MSYHSRANLTHKYLTRKSRFGKFLEEHGLAVLVKYRGPLRLALDGRYPDEFLESVRLIRSEYDTWDLRVRWGDYSETAVLGLEVEYEGRVSEDFAEVVMHGADSLVAGWLEEHGLLTSAPPEGCPNEVHKEWHDNYSRFDDPAFVPDDGLWRCVGCGWLLDSDGTRIRETYMAPDDKTTTARKVGSYKGQA